jgi:beta-lactamase regulating signal transducer with metallopeptidase domain
VHTVLGFSSILLVVVGCALLLRVLRSIALWSQRRLVQSFVLAMPIMTLGIGVSGMHHFIGPFCFATTPFWDLVFGVVFPLGMVVIALGALGLGALRLILLAQVVWRCRLPAPLSLRTTTERLAKRLNVGSVRVWLCTYDRPLAFTCGIFIPTILVSTWMLEHFDQQELEAVLTHELEHVARHDYLIIFLATVMRDAFFYLPTSRVAYRQLQREKELICDDLTVQVTRRPLALASALAKVWLHAAETPQVARFGAAQPFAERGEALSTRIERLLAQQTARHAQPSRVVTLSISAIVLLILLVVQGVNFFIILSLLHCNHLALLETWF